MEIKRKPVSLYKFYTDVKQRLEILEMKFPECPELQDVRKRMNTLEQGFELFTTNSFYVVKPHERGELNRMLTEMQTDLHQIEASLDVGLARVIPQKRK